VLQPIKDFIDEKIETSASKATTDRYKTKRKKIEELNKKYFDIGVNQKGLDDIAQELQVDLYVSLPFQNDNLVAKSNKKPLRTFRYINTRLNHVDYDKVSHIDNRITVEKHELIELQQQLDIIFPFLDLIRIYCVQITTLLAKHVVIPLNYKLKNGQIKVKPAEPVVLTNDGGTTVPVSSPLVSPTGTLANTNALFIGPGATYA
jgi:hypothetical protein